MNMPIKKTARRIQCWGRNSHLSAWLRDQKKRKFINACFPNKLLYAFVIFPILYIHIYSYGVNIYRSGGDVKQCLIDHEEFWPRRR